MVREGEFGVRVLDFKLGLEVVAAIGVEGVVGFWGLEWRWLAETERWR